MSLERIERYLKELEAIKHYKEVKREKDELLKKVEELESELRAVRERAKEYSEKIIELEREITKRGIEIANLKSELNAKDGKIRELEETLSEYKLKIAELEEVRATAEGKTVAEVVEEILRRKEDEIKKRSEEIFVKKLEEWRKEEKSREVQEEAIRLLSNIINALRDDRIPEGVEVNLLEKVRELIDAEVDKRINDEFEKRVEEESNRRFVEKVFFQSEWYKERVEPLILKLYLEIKRDVLKALRGPWNVKCDKCGCVFSTNLSSDEVEELIRRGYVWIECPSCEDFLLVWSRRHRIKLELKDLLKYYFFN
ncbi:hypothetical protein DRP04_15015 [Archaeoglobales archaeon]|nr:MAG: hypothetical protein DRP04_15015 [Archaeoglobales archaeon]